MSFMTQQIQVVDSILYKLRCYRDPARVRADIIELLKVIPTLQPGAGSLGANNSFFLFVAVLNVRAARGPSQAQIMFLSGTVPIVYNSVQYNIPVSIWLVETYPLSPPLAYVTPTPGTCCPPIWFSRVSRIAPQI